jgi:hypothetical protein
MEVTKPKSAGLDADHLIATAFDVKPETSSASTFSSSTARETSTHSTAYVPPAAYTMGSIPSTPSGSPYVPAGAYPTGSTTSASSGYPSAPSASYGSGGYPGYHPYMSYAYYSYQGHPTAPSMTAEQHHAMMVQWTMWHQYAAAAAAPYGYYSSTAPPATPPAPTTSSATASSSSSKTPESKPATGDSTRRPSKGAGGSSGWVAF